MPRARNYGHYAKTGRKKEEKKVLREKKEEQNIYRVKTVETFYLSIIILIQFLEIK